jgi:hypothetical protein
VARADDSLATLVERADGLMYGSKRAGKNRITQAPAAPSGTETAPGGVPFPGGK